MLGKVSYVVDFRASTATRTDTKMDTDSLKKRLSSVRGIMLDSSIESGIFTLHLSRMLTESHHRHQWTARLQSR